MVPKLESGGVCQNDWNIQQDGRVIGTGRIEKLVYHFLFGRLGFELALKLEFVCF